MISRTKVVFALAGAMAVAIATAIVYRAGYEAGSAAVQSKWNEREREIAAAMAEQAEAARKTEQHLREQLRKQSEAYHASVRAITVERDRLAGLLRDRPEARAGVGGVPEGATAGVGCTGEGLSRGDSEFLIGLAADAARTQAALQQCVAQYNQVMELVNGGD